MCVLSIKVPIRKKSLETYLMSLVSSTLQCNITLHYDIYCDLTYRTTLAYLRLQIITSFSSKCNDDVLLKSPAQIGTQVHKETNKEFFSGRPVTNLATHLSGRQPQVYLAAYVSTHTHMQNTTYTSTYNNTQL